jgi:hypothetical protein
MSSATVFWGNAKAETLSMAEAEAYGINGWEAASLIGNSGDISVDAYAVSAPSSEADTDVDTNEAHSTAGAVVEAAGIMSGGESDAFINDTSATISVNAKTETNLDALSDEDSSVKVGTENGFDFSVTALGVDLGDGHNGVLNYGTITVTAQEVAQADALSSSLTNEAQSYADLNSKVDASGISLGIGDDKVANYGGITVNAEVDDTATALTEENHTEKSTANIGTYNDTPLTINVTGIDAQEGDNLVVNYNQITSGITETLINAKAEAHTTITTTHATAKIGLTAGATGISAGAGDDVIMNGDVDTPDSVLNVNTYLIKKNNEGEEDDEAGVDAWAVADEYAYAECDVKNDATGINAGNGNNIISNYGDINVDASERIKAYARASSTIRYAESEAYMSTEGQAVGILSESGNDLITNVGDITVTKETIGDIEARDGGNTNTSIAGRDGDVLSAYASGISAGDGNDDITSDGGINILSDVKSIVYATADCDLCNETAEGYARAEAIADGISTGNGINEITNEDSGIINVSAKAEAETKTNTPDRLGPDEYARLDAKATANAYGIKVTGNDYSEIRNYGTLSVTSEAKTYVEILGDTPDDYNYYQTAESVAAGIKTGNGNNYILNDGNINVTAKISYRTGLSNANDNIITEAIGIQTGNGNDTIYNYGTINTSQTINGVTTLGTGIDTGSGNDQVFLEDGSLVDGNINLGSGNDGLTVKGTADVTGTSDGGSDTDTLTLVDATVFDVNKAVNFETTVHEGSGTATVMNMPAMQRIQVEKGSLKIQGDYQIDPNSTVQTQLYGDETAGQLVIEDTALLAGTLSVVKGPGVYKDGTVYTVFNAGSIENASEFDEIVLPETTPLLDFSLLPQNDNSIQVQVDTEDFITVATNTVESSIAKYMDKITPSATGDLSDA